MSDYIKREDAIYIALGFIKNNSNKEYVQKCLEEIPSADVVEHRRGKWIHESEVIHQERYRCSECGESFQCWVSMGAILPNFCSNCGADMRGSEMKWEVFKEAREKSMNRFMDARQTDIECPECGKKIYVRTNITIATYPPKSSYFCECGWSGTA